MKSTSTVDTLKTCIKQGLFAVADRCLELVFQNMYNNCSSNIGGMFARRAPGALLLDYVPPEEPPSTPLGNALRIR